jgi:ribosome-binding factor A
MAKNRVAQVQEVMKEELSKILFLEIEMPEGAIVTLTRVDASPNLQQAKVYISVMPDDKSKEVMGALQRNIYDIQQVLNERLIMRPVPKIKWVLETATAQAQRIEELLDKIKKEK